MSAKTVYIVEDNAAMRLGMSDTLTRDGFTVAAFPDGVAALKAFYDSPSDFAVVDLRMEPMDGFEVLRQMKQCNPAVQVLIVSAYGTVDAAVKAVRQGAADFLTKPFSPAELRIRVAKLLESAGRNAELEKLAEQRCVLSDELARPYTEFLGQSSAVSDLNIAIHKVASAASTVLITGESGSGKELVARMLHRLSPRAAAPFLKVNCAALNDNLLESELFGHVKGAFTGADRARRGRFELADTGTLFLDEIGDISPAMQVKLLRVLQEGEFEKVGGEETVTVDVRVISATNRNLASLQAAGKFRQDLYYRLNVIHLQVPPLRERQEDIIPLFTHFLSASCTRNGTAVPVLDETAVRLLTGYTWPGNVRELQNLAERISVVADSAILGSAGITPYLPVNHIIAGGHTPGLENALASYEQQLILEALERAGGIKNRAAKLLNISAALLHYKLEKYGLGK